mmetsp:Transcript_5341/g.6835  ORF Transcript_5341/g.6835 Transcript_5341/m.6835 type:complete len:275 (-) Transcript_5341:70-894(-)
MAEGKVSEADTNIRKEVWNGSIAVVVNLSKDEIAAQKTPAPFYCLLPRSTYLPLVSKEMEEHFKPFLSGNVEQIWFDFRGEPLRWHIFIGVLFDLYGGDNPILPWPLTVHFQNFPSQILLRCESQVLKNHYFQSLKEACMLKHKTSSVNQNLSDVESNRLWISIEKNNFDDFWELNTKLNCLPMENLPVRVCMKHKPPMLRPIPLTQEDGQEYSLLSLLQFLLPEKFPVSPGGLAKYPKVLIQGIFVPFDTPLSWLTINCCHPDNFLYVCVLDS